MDINLLFWIFALIAFAGTSVYYLGEAKMGNVGEIMKFSGGIATFGILITSFFFLGWKTSILLIIMEFTVISFVSAFVVEFFTKKRIK